MDGGVSATPLLDALAEAGERLEVLLVTGRASLGREVSACLRGQPVSIRTAPPGRLPPEVAADVTLADAGAPGRANLRRRLSPPVVWVVDRPLGRGLLGRLPLCDDFVSRPLASDELMGRITRAARAVRRLEADGVSLDRVAHAVTVEGRPVRLSGREFDLLGVLMARRGVVVSRDEIVARLWRDAGPESNMVDVLVLRLRRKLGRERIGTVRGLGYRFGV